MELGLTITAPTSTPFAIFGVVVGASSQAFDSCAFATSDHYAIQNRVGGVVVGGGWFGSSFGKTRKLSRTCTFLVRFLFRHRTTVWRNACQAAPAAELDVQMTGPNANPRGSLA